MLWEWGFRRAELGDDAGLVVSELITNAITAYDDLPPHAPLPPVRLWLASDTELVLVMVGDASSRPPLHVDPGPGADSGRGLRLVEAVSSRWGWYPANAAGTVKVVWAEWASPSSDQPGPPASPMPR